MNNIDTSEQTPIALLAEAIYLSQTIENSAVSDCYRQEIPSIFYRLGYNYESFQILEELYIKEFNRSIWLHLDNNILLTENESRVEAEKIIAFHKKVKVFNYPSMKLLKEIENIPEDSLVNKQEAIKIFRKIQRGITKEFKVNDEFPEEYFLSVGYSIYGDARDTVLKKMGYGSISYDGIACNIEDSDFNSDFLNKKQFEKLFELAEKERELQEVLRMFKKRVQSLSGYKAKEAGLSTFSKKNESSKQNKILQFVLDFFKKLTSQ